jgi:hypothetical protein
VRPTRAEDRRGQALVEFALVFPIFAMILFGIISLGLWVFYQQQLSNAAREAARYAAIHSSSAQCPTVSHLDPEPASLRLESYNRCDAPENGWPEMTAAGRSAIWGMSPASVTIVGCWSGYQDGASPPNQTWPQPGASYAPCTISGQVAEASVGGLPCPVTPSDAVDTAASLSYASGNTYASRVTVYACFNWRPPMAGFLLIPTDVTIRAGLTEVLERQQ